MPPARPHQTRQNNIRFVHWNIMELESRKLDAMDAQVKDAVTILQELAPDLLSVNEIQYDFRRALGEIPDLGAEIERQRQKCKMAPPLDAAAPAQNLTRFAHMIFGDTSELHFTFAPANTGLHAQPDDEGHYLDRRPEPTDHAQDHRLDRTNYGWFPAEYSCGLISRFRIKRRCVESSLPWRVWDPTVDLSAFDIGPHIAPDEMPLFDKNFNVSYVEIDGKQLAIINLHTVPAFDFGNPKSANVARNGAQLQFLTWFLLGNEAPSDLQRKLPAQYELTPLPADMPFIAVGDFNVGLSSDKPGAAALKRLFASKRVHNRRGHIDPAYLTDNSQTLPSATFFPHGPVPFPAGKQLDYFVVSRDIKIRRLETIYAAHGSDTYHKLRSASDHLPLLLEFALVTT